MNGVCAMTVSGQHLLASAGNDGTVRIWDPGTTACLLTIPVHHPALTAAWVYDSLVVGLSVGILVLGLNIRLVT